MQILVVAATQMEIAPFLAENLPVDHLVTGVGVPAALYHIQKKLQTKRYDLVVQAGIAGCFNAAIEKGKTVLVDKDVFADLGAMEKNEFSHLFDMGLADKNEWPFTNGWLKNNNELLNELNLPVVSAITVNMVSDDLNKTNAYIKLYNAGIESMEGAALHYVCLQEKINFLQLRSVSNKVGERDKSKWKIADAVENLNSELIYIIKLLNQKQ